MISTGLAAELDESVFERSLYDAGNTARLERVMARAEKGDTITVGVIGGSITGGARASKPEYRYGERIWAWWKEAFPKTRVEWINAGVGGTGSDFGSARVSTDLLASCPDFVVIEYSVNDGNTQRSAETLEGVVRQILKQPNMPAVVLLFMMSNPTRGGNAQEWHGKIGKHYGLPMISFRDALWPEIEQGRLTWEDIIADSVHPNDIGHKYAADFVIRYLERVRTEKTGDAPLQALPKALLTTDHEFTVLMNAGSVLPLHAEALALADNSGWTVLDKSRHGPAWLSETPGSTLEFDFEAKSVSVTFHRRKENIGVAEAWVDDGPKVKLEGLITADLWNNSCTRLVAGDLPAGRHHLTIRLSDELQSGSTGHYFEVRMIMTAGAGPLSGSFRPR